MTPGPNKLDLNDLWYQSLVASIANGLPGLVVLNPDGSNIAGGTGGGGNVNLNQVGGVAFGLGQTTAANSLPVVLPADVAPATQNITVVDSSSVSTAGANGQNLITGTPTVNSAATFAISSECSVRVMVSGIWTGTLTSEISIDGGTTWTAQGLHQGAYTTSTFAANFLGGASLTGVTNFRIRATVAVTGTATVKIIESANPQSVYIANAGPSGHVVSLLNSSQATLTSGSVFTGVSEDVSNFSEMRVSVFSNVASATDGLSIQQSIDNVNWDITDVYTIAAATGKTFVVPRQGRYFRIVYTNGGTNQTSFRLQVILNRTATAASSQRPMDARPNDNDMVEVLDYPMTYNSAANQWNRAKDIGVAGVPGVGVTDGTNAANILKSDGTAAGQNAAITAGAYMMPSTYSLTAGTQATGWVDMGNYAWVSVECSITSGALTFQTSNDSTQTTVTTTQLYQTTSSTPTTTTSSSASIIFSGPRTGRYFRVNSNLAGGATASVIITLYSAPTALVNQSVSTANIALNNAGIPTSTAMVGGSDGSNIRTFTVDSSGNLKVISASATGSAVPGNAFYMGVNAGGSGLIGILSASSTSDGYSGAGLAGTSQESYNGTNYDRTRNNTTASVIAAGATASNAGVSVTTYNASKAVIVVNVTAITGTLTVTINGVTASGYNYPILVSTAIATTGTTPLRIGEGLTASANAVANDILPRTIQVVTVVTGTCTYGVDNELSL